MFKKYVYVILITLLSVNIYASEASIEQKINKLNQESIESLGISLNALTYLASASPYSYFPLEVLKLKGDIGFIKELEEAGYVKVTEQKGLPDGSSKNEIFLNITPLSSGNDLRKCMQDL